jgi:hemolysin activation/secretion protein
VTAGSEPGSTDFHAELAPARRLGGYALIDNQGSKYTGIWRLGAGFHVNSPGGFGDRLSFSGLVSENGRGILSGRLAYSVPISNGLSVTLAAARTTYELGEELSDIEAVGKSDSLELELAYPFVRSGSLNLWGAVKGSVREIRDELKAFDFYLDKTARALTFQLRYDQWLEAFGGRSLFLAAEGSTTFSHVEIPEEPDNRQAGRAARANLSLSADLGLTDNLRVALKFQGQKLIAGDVLEGGEQFIISGPSGIRAFRETSSGDNGWVAEFEIRRYLPRVAGIDHTLAAFAATSRAWMADGSYVASNGVRLSDVGLTYRASRAPLFLTLQLATAVGPWPEEVVKEGRTKLVGQFGVVF